MSGGWAIVVDAEHFGPRLELAQNVVRQVHHLSVDDAEASCNAGEPPEFLRNRGARHERDDDARDLAGIALTTPDKLAIEFRRAAGGDRK